MQDLKSEMLKQKILIKLRKFYTSLEYLISKQKNIKGSDFQHINFDLDYLRDLIDTYTKYNEYLTKEDLMKVNDLYKKYKKDL